MPGISIIIDASTAAAEVVKLTAAVSELSRTVIVSEQKIQVMQTSLKQFKEVSGLATREAKQVSDLFNSGLGTDKAGAALDGLTKSLGESRAETAKFKAGLGDISGALKGLVDIGNIVKTAGEMLFEFAQYVDQAIGSVAELGRQADQLGLTTNALQELRYAAEISGVGMGTLEAAMQNFSRGAAEAAKGQGELVKVAKEHDVTLSDSSSLMRDSIDIIGDFAECVKNAESQQERLRIATQLFGSDGAAMVKVLEGGREGLTAMSEEARRLGVVLDEGAIRASEKADEALTRLGAVVRTNLASAVAEAAPDIEALAESLTKAFVEHKDQIVTGVEVLITGFEDIVSAVNALADNIEIVGPLALSFMGTIAAPKITAIARAIWGLDAAVTATTVSVKLLRRAVLIGLIIEAGEELFKFFDETEEAGLGTFQSIGLGFETFINRVIGGVAAVGQIIYGVFDVASVAILKTIDLAWEYIKASWTDRERADQLGAQFGQEIGKAILGAIEANIGEAGDLLTKRWVKLVDDITYNKSQLEEVADDVVNTVYGDDPGVQKDNIGGNNGNSSGDSGVSTQDEQLAADLKAQKNHTEEVARLNENMRQRIQELTLNDFDMRRQRLRDWVKDTLEAGGDVALVWETERLERGKIDADELNATRESLEKAKEFQKAKAAVKAEYTDEYYRLTKDELKYQQWALDQWYQSEQEKNGESFELGQLYVAKRNALTQKAAKEELRINGSLFEGLAAGFVELGEKQKTFYEHGQELANTAWSEMQSSMSDLFFDVMKGEMKDVSEYFDSFLNSMTKAVANAAAEMAATQMVKWAGLGLDMVLSSFHTGVVNLKEDELLSVLQKDETVIPAKQAKVITDVIGGGSDPMSKDAYFDQVTGLVKLGSAMKEFALDQAFGIPDANSFDFSWDKLLDGKRELGAAWSGLLVAGTNAYNVFNYVNELGQNFAQLMQGQGINISQNEITSLALDQAVATGVSSLGGGIIGYFADMAMAEMGFDEFALPAKLLSTALGFLIGGPVGSMIGTFAAPLASIGIDRLMDWMDLRQNESFVDALEDSFGVIDGHRILAGVRRQYAEMPLSDFEKSLYQTGDDYLFIDQVDPSVRITGPQMYDILNFQHLRDLANAQAAESIKYLGIELEYGIMLRNAPSWLQEAWVSYDKTGSWTGPAGMFESGLRPPTPGSTLANGFSGDAKSGKTGGISVDVSDDSKPTPGSVDYSWARGGVVDRVLQIPGLPAPPGDDGWGGLRLGEMVLTPEQARALGVGYASGSLTYDEFMDIYGGLGGKGGQDEDIFKTFRELIEELREVLSPAQISEVAGTQKFSDLFGAAGTELDRVADEWNDRFDEWKEKLEEVNASEEELAKLEELRVATIKEAQVAMKTEMNQSLTLRKLELEGNDAAAERMQQRLKQERELEEAIATFGEGSNQVEWLEEVQQLENKAMEKQLAMEKKRAEADEYWADREFESRQAALEGRSDEAAMIDKITSQQREWLDALEDGHKAGDAYMNTLKAIQTAERERLAEEQKHATEQWDTEARIRALQLLGYAKEAEWAQLLTGQEEELYQARLDGLSEERLRALKTLQLLERIQLKNEQIAKLQQTNADIQIRYLNATGQNLEAALMQFDLAAAQEYRDAVKNGADLALLDKTLWLERQAILEQYQDKELTAVENHASDMANAKGAALEYLSNFRQSITEYLEGLEVEQNAPHTSPTSRLSAAQEQFDKYYELAQGGDRSALDAITGYADTLLSAGKDMYASGSGYQDIYAYVTGALDELPDLVPVDELILQELQSINTSTTTTATATTTTADNTGSWLGEFGGYSAFFDDWAAQLLTGMDANADMMLSLDELSSYAAQNSQDMTDFLISIGAIEQGQTATNANLQEIFNEIDANGDGVISATELVEHQTKNVQEALVADNESKMLGRLGRINVSSLQTADRTQAIRLSNNDLRIGMRQMVRLLGGAPSFESGGLFSGGMARVHSGEMIYTGPPAYVMNAAQTSRMAAPAVADNVAMGRLLESFNAFREDNANQQTALRGQIDRLTRENRQMRQSLDRMAQ